MELSQSHILGHGFDGFVVVDSGLFFFSFFFNFYPLILDWF